METELSLEHQIVASSVARFRALQAYKAKRTEMKDKGRTITDIQITCEALRRLWLGCDEQENKLIDDYLRTLNKTVVNPTP